MKTLFYSILILNTIILNGFGQTPQFKKALQFKGNRQEIASQIAYDTDGNSYHLCRSSSDAITIGNVSIPANAPSGGSRSTTVLVKLNKNLEVVWTIKDNVNTQFGNFFTDNFKNIYLEGSVEGGSFQYGNSTIVSIPGKPISFVLKIDRNNNLIWLKKKKFLFSNFCAGENKDIYLFRRSLRNDTIDNYIFKINLSSLIKVDTSGTIIEKVDLGIIPDISSINYRHGKLFISGEYDLDTKTDTTVWKLPKINFPTVYTVSEAYVAAFDTSLQLSWARTSRSLAGNFQFFGLAASAKPNFTKIAPNDDLISFGIYVADTVYFGNKGISTGQNALSQEAGRINMFLNCYDNEGNIKWARTLSSNLSDYAMCLAIDSLSNITIGGYGDTTVGNPLDYNFFIIKFNSEGNNSSWRKTIPNQGYNRQFNALEVDNKGNYYLNGYFWKQNSTISPLLQLDSITLTLTTAAANAPTQPDLFIGKIGNCNLANPSISATSTQSICLGDSLTLICSAFQKYQWSTSDTSQSITIKKPGRYHCYIYDSLGCYAKSNVVEVKVKQPTASFILNSICQGKSYLGYSQAGTYKDTLTGSNGCDSVRTLTLIVNPIKTGNLLVNICPGQNYQFGNKTISLAGVYKDTITSSLGCDSIRTLTLGIKSSSTKAQTINLCQGQSLQVGIRIYTAAGIYKDTLTAANGCDSIITSTINYSIPSDSIKVTGNSFSAANDQDSYQWLDCNAGLQIISGATQQSFTPPGNGSYAVRTTKGNCADTSNCVLYTSGKELLSRQIRIYPQPVKDKLYINMPETSQTSELVLMDAMGRIVLKEKGIKFQSISVLRLPAGLYQLKVLKGKDLQVFGVMVER